MANSKPIPESIAIPARYPCATFFVDESSARATSGSFFVVGAVKVRQPGKLLREIEAVRDKLDCDGELKFSRISRGRLTTYYQLIDALETSDAHITACVVDRSRAANPFNSDDPEWLVHARITAKLLVGSLNSRELGSAILDKRSTPVKTSFGDTVRSMVNQRLKAVGLVSVVCADSQCNDGLQLADLVAGAVAHQRRGTNPNSHKGRVAARLAAAFGVDTFAHDQRTDRVNVLTHGVRQTNAGRSTAQPGVVELQSRAR